MNRYKNRIETIKADSCQSHLVCNEAISSFHISLISRLQAEERKAIFATPFYEKQLIKLISNLLKGIMAVLSVYK